MKNLIENFKQKLKNCQEKRYKYLKISNAIKTINPITFPISKNNKESRENIK